MKFVFVSISLFSLSQACLVEHIARSAKVSAADDCVGQTVSADSVFAIVNAQVFNGADFEGPQMVLVSGTYIAAVGGAAPPGIETVDATGKYLIPGLIESHVHPQSCSDLSALAGYGVTTAINMACLNYTACAELKRQLGTTDYITAGQIAAGTGSVHATVFDVPATNTIGPNTTDAELQQLVDYTFRNGSYLFKVVAEANGPSTEQQATLVQQTHQRGRLAATHATLMEFYEQAIQSKVDSIQHSPADALLSETQINQILSQGQFVVPTMEFYRIAFAHPLLGPVLGFNSSCNYSNIQTNVANMHAAGVPIAVGTDSIGNFEDILDLPFGRTLHCELQNLVDAGLGNAEAIEAATAGAAKLYRLADRGSITPGMRADLLLLNSNPVANIANSLDINSVWAGGIQITNITAQKGQTCDPTSSSF